MAKVLKRCRSTIFRELRRNHFSDESMPKHDGYYGAAANLMQADRRARDRKLIKYPELCKRVIERIKDGLREDLWWYLPTHRVAHRPRRTRRRREPKFHRDVSICSGPMTWLTVASLDIGKVI
jgi:IS30 family transposase